MKVLFTVKLKEEQERELIASYPAINFYFSGSVDDASLKEAEIIVTFGSDITDVVLDNAKSLKWIMVASAGVDHMPLELISRKNMLVTNVSGIHKTPMAESVLAHILAIKRSLPEIYALQETREWQTKIHSTELKGSTALIVGPGEIGAEIGRLLKAFDVRTIGCNRSGRQSESIDEMIKLDDLVGRLPEADFVISLLPSTRETKNVFTEIHFEVMKKSAVFMNFGRGDVVSEQVLIEALKSDKIKHAVLDVFEEEPLPVENELWALENCTVSPHVSSKSGKYIERSLKIFTYNLSEWLKEDRQFKNIVDLEVGY